MTSLRVPFSRVVARQGRSIQVPLIRHASSSTASESSRPLLPSVAHLLHEYGLSTSDASKIPGTGPSGRLLKGDVLAHLGSIPSSAPSELSKRLSNLSHLDLSNIKLAAPKPKADTQAAQPTAAAAAAGIETPMLSEISLPISLAAVVGVQKKVQTSLGVHLPLSVFLARATELANEGLPRRKGGSVSADELFDAVLGLDNLKSTERGDFTPLIEAVEGTKSRGKERAQEDVLDALIGSHHSGKKARKAVAEPKAGASNVFSVSVAKGEETRGRLFLERVKTILEVEPGRLVL
ncbi:MAG: pyridoxine biosynthesis protein [Vezdaea aestivalis]|nr:MAG: pyridoxine biosynthesis protein [Vezdaea aestivalis]